MMEQRRIAILSLSNDLHALAVRKKLEDKYGVACSIIETERVSCGSGLTWSSADRYPPTLQAMNGEQVNVRDIDVVWWRRINAPQRVPPDITEPGHLDFISNDCREAVLGLLLNEFAGVWVSDPEATRRAENKLVQLRAAERVGFRIPQTLVSQNPLHIRSFCASLGNRVVIKAVKGTIKSPVLTTMVNETMLNSEESLRLCPAIYQEFIPGTQHVRANCFGDSVYAALIESEDLDWRPNLNVPVRAFNLPDNTIVRLRKVLQILGLKMGIVDLKLDEHGEPVWLEVNPQGQFLFIEGLCGLKLIDACSDFLYSTKGKRQN
jgi:hypothetical protein